MTSKVIISVKTDEEMMRVFQAVSGIVDTITVKTDKEGGQKVAAPVKAKADDAAKADGGVRPRKRRRHKRALDHGYTNMGDHLLGVFGGKTVGRAALARFARDNGYAMSSLSWAITRLANESKATKHGKGGPVTFSAAVKPTSDGVKKTEDGKLVARSFAEMAAAIK